VTDTAIMPAMSLEPVMIGQNSEIKMVDHERSRS
jgi:hypothetical protein